MLPYVLPISVAILLAMAYILYLLFSTREKDLSFYALLAGLAVAVIAESLTLQSLLQPERLLFWTRWTLLTEACFPLAWFLFALTYVRAGGLARLSPLPRILLLAAPLLPLAVLVVPVEFYLQPAAYRGETVLLLRWPALAFCVVFVVYLTCALMQLERTFVALPRLDRWRVKFEALGAGTLLAMYLVYFSQALLYGAFAAGLLPARALALAAAVTLMAFSRLCRGEATRIQISPAIAFRSLVAFAVGTYLFALGLLGEGLRTFDPGVQRMLMPMAALTGGIAVVAVFLSETMRRRIRVALHKNFYRDKYDYRDHWRRFTRRVGTAGSREELQQAILAIFGDAFAIETTVLYLREADGDTWRAVAAQGDTLPPETFAGGNSLLHYLAKGEWVFASRDENPRIWQENRDFLDRRQVSFIVPLHGDGSLEGFVVLGAPINRREVYTYEDFDLMKLLAAQAASALRGRRLNDQLAAARELAAIGKVAAFVLHDLKNLGSSLALVVDNARHALDNAEFRADMLLTLDDSVRRMKGLIGRLQNLREKANLELETGDLAAVVREGVRQAGAECAVEGGPVPASFDREELRKVVVNLLLNAREAGSGPLRVEVGQTGRAYFRVRDSGCGMSEDFVRHRLFRPFETTKTHGIGIGLYQCRQIVEAHGGAIEVTSVPGRGSEFTVWLPPIAANGALALPAAAGRRLDSYSPPATFHDEALIPSREGAAARRQGETSAPLWRIPQAKIPWSPHD